jgi:hypothetical protein
VINRRSWWIYPHVLLSRLEEHRWSLQRWGLTSKINQNKSAASAFETELLQTKHVVGLYARKKDSGIISSSRWGHQGSPYPRKCIVSTWHPHPKTVSPSDSNIQLYSCLGRDCVTYKTAVWDYWKKYYSMWLDNHKLNSRLTANDKCYFPTKISVAELYRHAQIQKSSKK